MIRPDIQAYFNRLAALAGGTTATDGDGQPLNLDEAVHRVIGAARTTHDSGRKLMVIGNGGSAAIASHVATDYSKNGGIRTQCFNDGAFLTCLGNDLGYENVFAKPIELFGQDGDLLLAISSSGRSVNILNGVGAARRAGCRVVTFSGFDADNPLRRTGDVNFHVASHLYGFVEIAHLGLCHAILDMAMGWTPGEVEVVLP